MALYTLLLPWVSVVRREQRTESPRALEPGKKGWRCKGVPVRDGDLMLQLLPWCPFGGDMRDLWLSRCYRRLVGR